VAVAGSHHVDIRVDTLLRAISYQLQIEIPRPLRCVIGRLGEFDFAAGRYVYTGSARRGLEARIARHLRPEKTLRWHIDYLLAAPGVRVVDVIRSQRSECALNRVVPGSCPVRGFGASDCSAGCVAHLKYLG
jgi:Uri superfamily endonuclease